jgi:nucleoredoxin
MAFAVLFGASLLTKDGLKPTEEVLAKKAGVLVYFSAHWCPPCRGFTPKLAEFHNKHAKDKNFETVFVSSDEDKAAFDNYYAEQPWTSMPYEERELKEKLSKKYKVKGIPSLVVLGPDGNVITTDGRTVVMENFETAAGFPWIPPTLNDALGNEFITKDGSKITADALKGKTVGLYFSAHWCPPCRGFTPVLKQFYTDLKAKDPNFEIIFVSSDKTDGEMLSYFKDAHGDYLALPHENRAAKDGLSKLCEVEGIPSFAIVDFDSGKIVNTNARGRVQAGVDSVLADGWGPAIVGDLAAGPDAAGSDINESPTVVVLFDKAPAAVQASIFDAMKPLATKYFAESQATGDDIKYIFLTSKASGGVVDQLKMLTQKDAAEDFRDAGDEPLMLLFDIPGRILCEL